jgi:calcineurin-like phosphoesterase family protein
MKTFAISDFHLDHANIIKHCNRPFKNIHDMNNTIVHRWNSVVSNSDQVYFLGDFCGYRTDPYIWLKKLNGSILFVEGNHDKKLGLSWKWGVHPVLQSCILRNKRNDNILLVHEPSYKDEYEKWHDMRDDLNFKGWMIHGHTHNNQMERYPLINHKNKTINVSCELLNYFPREIKSLLEMR